MLTIKMTILNSSPRRIFNTTWKNFTNISTNNKMTHNIFIHDTRDVTKPTTLIAKKGNIT